MDWRRLSYIPLPLHVGGKTDTLVSQLMCKKLLVKIKVALSRIGRILDGDQNPIINITVLDSMSEPAPKPRDFIFQRLTL